MEVLDFEVPAEWQFGEDAYPTAAKRLVNSLAGGKKKSNKHLSEERIEDVISKNVQLPIQLAQQPEADAAPVSKKQRKANAASPLDTGAGAADANSKPAKNDRAAATPAQTEKPKPQAQLAQAKVPRKKGAAAGAASGGDGADDDVNPAMLAALSSAMQKQECKRVSFETPGGADEDAAAAEVRPGKKQKQQREPHAGSQRVQTQQPGAAVEVPAGKGKGKQQQQQAPNAVPVAAQAKGVEGQTTAPADASGPKHGKDTGKKSVDPMSRDVNPDVSAHGRQAGKKQKEGHADKHVEEYQHQATHPSTQGKASKEGKEQPSTSQQQQPGALAVKPVMGKRLKRKLRQAEEAAKLASVGAGAVSVVGAHAAASTSSQEQLGAGSSKGSGLLERMRAKLAGGHFRYLNEQLYTRSGKDAFTMMQAEPALFKQYHDGFQSQTKGWPKQPLDVAVNWLKSKPKDFVVADFGCGDARLSKTVQQTVHSFDLVANAPGVIACNMAAVPLPDISVDVAVFSLALMGTDYGAFIVEATRVLKYRGWLWIAEVRSRFASGSDEEGAPAGPEDFAPFLRCLARLGYTQHSQDASNRMFVVWVLRKTNTPPTTGMDSLPWPTLKACMYKKR